MQEEQNLQYLLERLRLQDFHPPKGCPLGSKKKEKKGVFFTKRNRFNKTKISHITDRKYSNQKL